MAAQLQDQVFRDEVDWDLSDPQNTPYKYASAVCYELGLDWDAATAVAAEVETQLQASWQLRISPKLSCACWQCARTVT